MISVTCCLHTCDLQECRPFTTPWSEPLQTKKGFLLTKRSGFYLRRNKKKSLFLLRTLHDVRNRNVFHSTSTRMSNVTKTIEGFGGKRALVLHKIELCQKRSKFRMQFCLYVLNNVLHVFSLKLASFLRYYVCEKTHFSEGIL